MKAAISLVCCAASLASVLLAESKVKLESLPPALQAAIKQHAKGADITGISKEREKGRTLYEVESTMNGKTRDLMVDTAGALISVEEETTLENIPMPAREAIQKKAAGGSIKKVEIVTHGSSVSYEAAYTGKNGKSAEVEVNADGSIHRN